MHLLQAIIKAFSFIITVVRNRLGKSTLHIASLSNVNWFEEWKKTQKVKKRGVDYETYKKTLGHALLERALNYLPHLRDKVS